MVFDLSPGVQLDPCSPARAPQRLTHCPICNRTDILFRYASGDVEFHVTDKLFEFWFCKDCQSYFQNPVPPIADIPAFYAFKEKSDYCAYAPATLPKSGFFQQRILARPFSPLRREFAALTGVDNRIADLRLIYDRSGTRPRRVLDIGCGKGHLGLLLVRDLGLPASSMIGIDIADNVEELGRAAGLDLRHGELSDLPERDFDLIIMSHVLEHLPSPRKFLEEVAARLVPGGRLAISVPNARSIPARLFGRQWVCHSIPRHIFNFSRRGVLAVTEGIFELEAYSAEGFYTFMFSRYFSRRSQKIVRLLSPLIRGCKPLLAVLELGDNQAFIFRRAG